MRDQKMKASKKAFFSRLVNRRSILFIIFAVMMVALVGIPQAASAAGDDFVIAVDDNSRLYYAKSNGDGTWSDYKYVDYLGGGVVRGVAINDFDGDGDQDFIVGRDYGTATYFYLFLNDGANNFTKTMLVGTLTNSGSAAEDMASGDFNNDGNIDFIANADSTTTGIYLAFGDGSGGFSKTEVSLGGTGRGLDVGDFDNDGNLDFVRGKYSDGLIYIYWGDGSGAFPTNMQVGDAGSDPYGVAAGDFDNDGYVDVIANAGSSGDATRWMGNGDRTFDPGISVPSLDFNNHGAYDAYDYNGDGNLDIVAVNYSGTDVYYYPGNGDGTFGASTKLGDTSANTLGVSAQPIGAPAGVPFASLYPSSTTVATGVTVDFDGSSSSDSDGTIASWELNFGDGSPVQSGTGTPGVVPHAYANEGIFYAKLKVTDNDGKSDYAASKVTVRGGSPTINTTPLTFGEALADNGIWNLSLNGASYASDSEGVVKYHWTLDGFSDDFEDGNDNGWTRFAGTWGVSSTSPISGVYSYSQSSTSLTRTPNQFEKKFDTDLIIEADIKMTAGTREEARIQFKALNEQNYYEYALRGGTYNDVLFYKRVNGSDSSLHEYDLVGMTIDLNTLYHVKIVCTGSWYDFYLNGKLLFSWNDTTYTSGKIGLSTYQTAVLFDNLTVTAVSSSQTVTHAFPAGTHNVQLEATDAAGQTAIDTIPMTMQVGASPVSNADGPYTVDESSANGGGWTVALNGTGSSDDVEIRRYIWDFGVDNFAGTTFNTYKWFTNGGVTQNNEVSIVGAGAWDTRYMVTRGTFPKVKGQTMEVKFKTGGSGEAMIGFKNNSTSNFHYNQYLYQFYLNSGNVQIYEAGTSRGNTAFGFSYNTWYDLKIELKDTGATFYFRQSGTPYWFMVYDSSTAYADTTLRKGIVVNTGTWVVDDFRETTAGASPSFQLYRGTGTFGADLTVYDRASQSSTSSTTITVNANNPPVADAGPDQNKDETNAVDGTWTVSFNASGSSDDYGIYKYEWDWAYDGTFDPSSDTSATPTHSWTTPGGYPVAVRVTDHALQTAMDTMTVTITAGSPPEADADGPYAVDEFTGNSFEGGWTVALDGTGSSDDAGIAKYVWDLGTDTFNGTTIHPGKWVYSTGVTQNNEVTMTGTGSWGQRYLFSKDTYTRAKGMAFEAKVKASGQYGPMIGFKNTSTSYNYNQMPYAIYFNYGNLLVYEDGNSRGDTGFDVTANTWYDVRIELKPTQGARYYYRLSGTTNWILIYDSNYGTATTFKRGLDQDTGTVWLDDVKEIAAGVSPSYRFYGVGSNTISLTVYDHANQTDTDFTSVTISANDPPVANAGPDKTGDESNAFENTWTFTFNGVGTDDHDGIYKYEWDWAYDGTFDPSGDTTTTVTRTFSGPGVTTIAFRVTDHAFQSHLDTVTITRTIGAPPNAEAGPDLTTEGHWPVVFNGGGSTDDFEIYRYGWNFGDGKTGVGRTPTHNYWAAGDYTVTLTVYDNALQSDTDTMVVHVITGTPPAAEAGGPYTAGAGGPPAYFNGNSSTDDHGIVKFLWDVDSAVDSDGDGNFTNDQDVVGRKPFHTYSAAGVYTVTLTVVDGAGQTSTDTATVSVATNLAPDVVCVPWVAANPLIPHETYNGFNVRLKCIVRDAGNLTGDLKYQWNFGDGSAPTAWANVTNKYAIEADHVYPASPDGTPFTATLTVRDTGGTGLIGSDNYYIIVRPNNADTKTNIAIDDGLWYMHKNQNKTDGKWSSYGSYYTSSTASSLQAFEINGHLEDGDNQENPYVETVRRGFQYLFTRLRTQTLTTEPAGNPDSNGNGIGLSSAEAEDGYQLGMIMDAIASSNAPLGFATTGHADVKGRFYFHILTDMVDMYAWSQADSGSYRGGWRYDLYDYNDSDNSAAQWGAIGMRAAEDSFGINIPQWVKNENANYWLVTSYNSSTGLFGYTSSTNPTPASTPGALVQLAFDGKTTSDTRWRTGEDYYANNWSTVISGGSYPLWDRGGYPVYAFTKAMRLARPDPVVILQATGLDWYGDPSVGIRKLILDKQTVSGTNRGAWALSGVGTGLSTAWHIIMLTPTLFVQPPVADAGDDVIWAYDLPLSFNASGSFHMDPARSIVLYEWDFDGNGTWDFTTTDPSDPNARYTYPDPHPGVSGDPPQTFTARLRVTDDGSPYQTDIDTREVTVAEPPHAPYADADGPYTATVGITFTLNGSGSYDIDPGDSITLYEWDLDNDGVWFNDVDLTTTSPTANWTFATSGVKNIALRVMDNGAFNPPGCTPGVNCGKLTSDPDYTTVTVQLNLPPVADAGGPYEVPEGTLLNLDGSGSSDPNGDKLTYAWDLDNDGQYDDSTAEKPTFSWPDDTGGPFTVGLKVSDSLLESTDTATVTVTNVRPRVDVGYDTSVNEGSTWTQPGWFTDPGADTWTATVDYGDGGGPQPLTLNPDKTFTLAHTWADNGTYTVTAVVTDDDGGIGTDTSKITVINLAPIVDAGPNAMINEGDTFTSSGSFTDPGADTWTATVDYGDGAGPQPLTLNPDKTFTLAHTYADNGIYTVTVTVTDDDGGSRSDAATVTVNNVQPTVNAGPDATIPEGDTFTSSGSFTDPGADTWTATVDYGDGSGIHPLPLNPDNSFNLSHTYADDGTYTVTVTVRDDDNGTGTDTVLVTVNNVPPHIDTLSITPGTLNESESVTLTSSFTDRGLLDTHTVDIQWGDGSSESFTLPPGSRDFTRTHQYVDDNPTGTSSDVNQAVVIVTDDNGGTDSETAQVTVNNVAPTVDAGPDASINTGDTFNSSGFFTDPGNDTWTATVDYGDGSGVQPLVLNTDKTFALSHTYHHNGIFTVTVTVMDDDSGSGSDTALVWVQGQTFAIGIPAIPQMIVLALVIPLLTILVWTTKRRTAGR